jgi:CheY-like chemotaxis protein
MMFSAGSRQERAAVRLDNRRCVSDVLGMHSGSNVKADTIAHDLVRARSVFIVDDDEALVEALTELLRDEGHTVEAHTDGARALVRLKEGIRPDVVLLDYLMPGMNGGDFLVHLEVEGIDVPVMLFTALNASRVHVPTRNIRAMISKPFDFKRLLEELEKVG